MKRSRWLLISTGGIALLAAATLLWWSSSSPKPVATTTPVAPTDTMASFEPKHVVQAKAVAAAPRPVMAAVSAEGGATPAAPWRAAFDGFKAWAEEFSSAPPAARQAWLAEGEKLAKARHQEMVRLIQEDPERALAEALPYRTRKAMPASLAGYLERSISGHGDFKVIEASLLPGQTGELPPTEYLVTLRKSMYRAYTYGVRMHQPSHKHIPMHGITLTDERGRKIMALGAEALRVVEPEEAKDVVAAGKVQAASTCPVCGATTVDAPQLTVADMGGEYVSFDNPQHAEVYSGQVNQALAKSWVSLGASPKDLAAASDNELFPAIPPLSHTGGRKGIMRLLMMPVMFSDDPVPPGTQDGLQGVCAGNAQTYKENSYGSVNWLSTVTPILHLPQRKAAYADGVAGGTPASVLGDGLAMARSLGYVDSYDDAYVLFN
ncbi:MAG: hypothetical protein NTW03_02240, partial [Verrucomicrobia bacterium]|nr:hypothetical protein [Verrucomicrobiota bacterium]